MDVSFELHHAIAGEVVQPLLQCVCKCSPDVPYCSGTTVLGTLGINSVHGTRIISELKFIMRVRPLRVM